MAFTETIYTIKVLSEEPIPEGADILSVLEEADTGSYVASIAQTGARTLSGPECAKLLAEYGSDSEFFSLNHDGSPLQEA